MIVESIENLGDCAKEGGRMAAAIKWLKENRNAGLAPGRYEIADKVYAMVSAYETKTSGEARFESHRAYIDIQCLLEGSEYIEVTDAGLLKVTAAYDADKDITFHANGTGHRILLKDGTAAVLYPRDAHKPCVAAGKKAMVKKLVIKVGI